MEQATGRREVYPPITNHSREDRFARFFGAHWFAVFYAIWAAWVALPFAAPLLLHWGISAPANWIYAFYSLQCHQLPERSFFLFGKQLTYSLPQIWGAFRTTNDPMVLRQFIGTPQMGWKVAWSDRMVSMYTFVLLFAGIWWVFRRRIGPLPLWGLALFLLPMAIDGSTHLVSDLGGLSQGFRFTNAWLATLTHNAFPATFYTGDAFGSFNSIVRLLTGLFFAMGVTWYALPRFADWFDPRPSGARPEMGIW